MALRRLLIAVLALACSACASGRILRDKDYSSSMSLARYGDAASALAALPTKERGGFITTTEKNWLGLWQGKANPAELIKLRESLDDRKVTRVSREAATFLLQETEEGYLPAEHEVVASHLIAAQAFLSKNDPAEARVEVRRAAEILQGDFNPDTPDFDDPALRVWLASLWTALGEWGEAQVDLRLAAGMTNSEALRRLAENPRPPPYFELQMYAAGPELEWSESSTKPTFWVAEETPSWMAHPLSTQIWYDRHQERITALHDTMVKSNYMSQFVGIKTASGVQIGAGAAASGVVATTGIALGVGLIGGTIYLLASSGASCSSGCGEMLGYIVAAGLVLIDGSVTVAKDIMSSVDRDTRAAEKAAFEDLRTYRYVRFLPSLFGWSLKERKPTTLQEFHLDWASPQGSKVRWTWVPERESPVIRH